jgi:hypothetical protein
MQACSRSVRHDTARDRCHNVGMYVATVSNRGSPPAVLLRESYCEAAKVKNRTLANLSHWPDHKVEALRLALTGTAPLADLSSSFEIARSPPHGHLAAVRGTLRRLGLEELICPEPSRQRDLVVAMVVVAMVVAQVIDPTAKLDTARGLGKETASSSLGEVLGVSSCDEDDLYDAVDWIGERQHGIEDALAARHPAVAPSCSTTSLLLASGDARVPSVRSGIPKTACAGVSRSSTGCSRAPMVCPSPSRCQRPTPAIRRRSRPR